MTWEGIADRYRIAGMISDGTYTTVFKAESYRPNGDCTGDDEEVPKTVAIKLILPHGFEILSEAIEREIAILQALSHDNIVRLYDAQVNPRESKAALVLEYADHTLRDILAQSRQRPLSKFTKKSLMYQILKGVNHMHNVGIMHRDLKPEHVLVVGHGPKRGQVKLADFGLARLNQPLTRRVVVTLWYRAPEVLLGDEQYSDAIDMWAVGCIFAEIMNAHPLFCGKPAEGSIMPFEKNQCDKIFRILGMPTPQTWEGMELLSAYQEVVQMGFECEYPKQSKLHNVIMAESDHNGAALYNLISRLLEYDPKKRLTAKEALEHDYFKQEPVPCDWAFDEPGKEPLSFREFLLPVADNELPWVVPVAE